ncbi:glycoside hydrolase family 24 [Bacilli bacterium]|nr:glycoside hydrolase family 24 [Bacilli bacterium]
MLYEIRFPEEISIKSRTMIEFDTNVIPSKNGKEQRAANRNARMVYEIASDVKTKNEIDNIINFFRLVEGRSIGFRYKDWLDFYVNRQVIGKADGLKKNFQLVKMYSNATDSSFSYLRKITKPVEGTVKIYVNDEEIYLFDVDHSTGNVSLNTAPAENSIVKATFEFDVPARFDTDTLEIRMLDRQSGEIGNTRIIEIL